MTKRVSTLLILNFNSTKVQFGANSETNDSDVYVNIFQFH